jgi:hypothetical protein
MHAKLKKMNPETTIPKLMAEMRIDPKMVGWNSDDEDFVD